MQSLNFVIFMFATVVKNAVLELTSMKFDPLHNSPTTTKLSTLKTLAS